MNRKLAVSLACLSILAGCGSSPERSSGDDRSSNNYATIADKVETRPDGTSTAGTLDAYKIDVAQRISQVNSTRVHTQRPQALLRSVIVVRYSIDRDGNLLRSEIVRSNRDSAAESIALATLKSAAPFPKPAPHLLRNGRVEMSESWLFNNDGRFQLRSVAMPQMAE